MNSFTPLKIKKTRRKKPLISRFEANVLPEPNSGCWLWAAGIQSDGYGTFRAFDKSDLAHRASLMLHRGAIPTGMHVLHKCDNRSCVNPDHLFLGSNYDNVLDKCAKGRAKTCKGSMHPQAKLNEYQVSAILIDTRTPYRLIAQDYGVTALLISMIKRRVCWKHVS